MLSPTLKAMSCAMAILASLVLEPTEAQAQNAQSGGAGRWGRDYFPNPTVFTQEGKPVRFYDDLIRGKMVVVSFIYTSCTDVCPLVTARLAEVQDKLGDDRQKFHFISLSVDPQRDTPEAMRKYAEAFRVKPNWTFVTGKPEDMKLIGFKLGERSRRLAEHQNDIVLGNDVSGEWARDSAFTDINSLAMTIRSMEPEWRNTARVAAPAGTVRPDANRPGQELFYKACAVCHTIGKGDKVGPDLKDVTTRRQKDWLARFITSPTRMRVAKDPIALDLVQRYPVARMPNIGLSENDVTDLLSYIDAMTYGANGTATGQTTAPAGSSHAHHH